MRAQESELLADMAAAANERATIGGNMPPEPIEPTPFELVERKIADLYDECKLWLDGAVVDSQELADGIGNLLAMIRAAEKEADKLRTEEKAALDEQVKAIQAKYAPLIADTKTVKGKTVLAADACKKALAPWLAKLEAEKQAKLDAARKEAAEKARLAQEAFQAADLANLEEREQAEALITEAKHAEKAVNSVARQSVTAGGNMGRAVGLRTVYTPVLESASEAVKHYWTTERDEIGALLLRLATRDVANGKRAIPGFRIDETKVAV